MTLPSMTEMELTVTTKLGREPSSFRSKLHGPGIESKNLYFQTPTGLLEYVVNILRYEKMGILSVNLEFAPPYKGYVEKEIDSLSIFP